MSPLRVVWARTVAQLFFAKPVALSLGAFFAAGAAMFAFNIEAAEGGSLSLPAVWAFSVSPMLPVLAAFVSMDVWSEEFRTRRIDLLLTVAVRERDFVLGKFLGVWTVILLSLVMFLVSSLALVWYFAPSAFFGIRFAGLIPALFILSLQSALWCAVFTFFSAFFKHSASALCASLLFSVVIPRGLWAAMMTWSQKGRAAFGEMPLDAHALDFSSGAFSTGTVLLYLIVILTSLFVTAQCINSTRFVGIGARAFRRSSSVAVVLSIVLAALASLLSLRLDVRFNIPVGQLHSSFSERTKRILSESEGEITITSYLPRSDRRFRAVAHFLRSLRRESESLGGVRLVLRFVDPRWDLAAAQRLVRKGVSEFSIVFEKGRRMSVMALDEGFGERLCSSALQRVATPPLRRNIYWTVGHGENSYEDYGSFGLSDIARDLSREGYFNRKIDFSAGSGVPRDCAMLVVAGAKDDFSRFEIGLVEAYLRQGGRLLVLASSAERGGVAAMLPSWGLRSMTLALTGVRTLSGAEVIVSDFSEHELAASLKGSRVVLGRPVGFVPSAVADAGAEKIDFFSIATLNDIAVAAGVERGAGVGSDIAVRPARIVAVGDSSFVLNGMLSARANANRDFFLNCVAYLSGSETFAVGGAQAGVLTTFMDRNAWMKLLISGTLAIPALVFAFMLAFSAGRRREK